MFPVLWPSYLVYYFFQTDLALPLRVHLPYWVRHLLAWAAVALQFGVVSYLAK